MAVLHREPSSSTQSKGMGWNKVNPDSKVGVNPPSQRCCDTHSVCSYGAIGTFWSSDYVLTAPGQCCRTREAIRVKTLSQNPDCFNSFFVDSYKEIECSQVCMSVLSFSLITPCLYHKFPWLFMWTMALTYFFFLNFFHSNCEDKRADCSLTKCTWNKMCFPCVTELVPQKKKLNASDIVNR